MISGVTSSWGIKEKNETEKYVGNLVRQMKTVSSRDVQLGNVVLEAGECEGRD